MRIVLQLSLFLCQQIIFDRIVEGNTLDVTEVRLAEGSGLFEGRVEIKVDGVWGTVCNEDFDFDDASVICRTINPRLSAILTEEYYGPGYGPVFVQEFKCSGFETHIRQCSYESNVFCTHSKDVGLICSECGIVSVQNGQARSISTDGTIITITCDEGYQTDSSASICVNGAWSPSSITCSQYGFPLDIISTRLVNGVGIADGRVEILVNDTWGTLCGKNIYKEAADVICHMQGFSDAQDYNYHYYGEGLGPVYLSNLECTGTERHINNCTYDIVHSCTHRYDLAVVCRHLLNITDIRLADGTGEYDGRVEVYSNDMWGTICNKYLNFEDLQTVCRMLNLNYTHQFATPFYEQRDYPILIGALGCRGDETTLNKCLYTPPSKTHCNHDHDLTLVCTDCGEIDDAYGTVYSNNGSVITVKCNPGYQPVTYTMQCLKNGTWIQQQSCSLMFDYPLDISDIRLVNLDTSSIPSEGLVEISVNGTWGTICKNNMNADSAYVICHMLGLEIKSFYTQNITNGQSSGPILIENLNCTGTETHINECTYDLGNSCTHTDDLAVECTGYQLIITDIRLAGTSGPYHGRVEIKVNETWGTVGDNFFRTPEAQVVCRMLGLEYKSYHLNAYYGQGSGPVLIDRLNCDPSASHINECRYSVNNYYNTQHNDDVSVTCWGPSLSITEARLVNGTGKHDGRVEIKVNGTWGTICDRNFDIYSADLICNMFGLRAVQYFSRALYGEGTGPIYINELYCDESDEDLSTCMYLYFNECTHDRDVSVVCNECGQPGINNYWDVGSYNYQRSILYIDCTYYRTYVGIFQLRCDNNTQTWIKEGECQEYSFPLNITDVRLVDGTSITSGRVEIKSLDTWGTVCGNSFGVAEANVICHMIGYPYAVEFYISAYHGEGTGPIFVDELSCGENGTHINNCTYITYDDCTHENDVSVVCLECENVTITNGFMTATDYNAVIKIECDSSFKLIGDSVITCQLNGLWSDIPTCSPIDCGYPVVPYADVIISNNRTTFGETIIVNCWPGYKINGNSSIDCGLSGQWENMSTCSPVDCGNISAPINGHVNDFQGTQFNAMIRFSCNAGYLLVGAENTKCEENGTWTNESPICVIKSGIGGSCINHEYCLLEGSQCVNNVCTCSTGIYDKLGNKCDTMPLMPFGADEGDYVIPDSSTCGPKIEFQPGFPIRNKLHTKLFVCRFGYISFDKVFENPTPPKSALSIDQDEMLLAPFYGPIDKRKSGPVTYKTYDILNSYNEMKEKKELISTIEMFVKRFGNLDWFHASFILIATWNKTVTIIPGFDSTKTSTFQIILVSDGKSTFSIFIYGNGMMNWKYNLSMAPPVWIGSSLQSLTYTQPYAFTNKALQLDIMSSVTVEDTEVSGLVFRELNTADTAYINSGVDCIRWYNENYEDKKHINYMANLMPECPCDITLSRYDPWFWRIGLYRWRYDLTHKCVDMLLIGNDWQHGKTCCYDIRSGLLINERPLAGSFQLYNRNYPNEHFKNDIEPKEKCCASSKYCSLYYELRPTGSCYRKSPYSFGSFWGVSHFSTLDGLNYTFNGLGEYTLLRIRTGNCSFDLQARKERAVKSNDNFSHASMFTAFAAKDKSSSVHVERNREHTGLNIYGNDVDLTKQYNDNTDEMEPFIWSSIDYLLTVSKHNESVNAYFSSCDISLSISLTTEMLILQTFVQSSFKNLTQGLLGNYNDDSSDDFITPNGSVLMSNLTEQEIFEYGQTWTIDPSNSAFKYDAGKDHFDFHNDSYVPRFLDDIDEHLKEKALEVCDSSTNIECIFDFAFTENAKIAKENNRIKEKLNEDKMEIDEDVPLLEGCSTLNIIRGQKSTCKLTISNGDSFHVVSKNINTEINQEESTVSFLPESNEPISIRIEAMNKNGRRSPQFALDIIMCTGCSNHGVCTSSLRTDLRENEYFRYHSCKCDLGYDGIDCENSFDGCAGSPCSLDRNCTKLQAEEQQAINKSYICDPCPDGYLDDNDDCIDKDECKVNNGGCSQHCSNTDGSFQCSCDDGYRLSIDDLYTCIDINECEELLHNCSHLCTNTEGGFTCQCFPGYELNWTSCVQISDGICSVTKQNDCRSADGCTVNGEDEECFCVNGYELDETGTKCLDINECGRHICSQGCLNTHGSYECNCFAGYRLEDTSTCKECENTFWGNDCEQECLCSGRGADKCHPVKGCICESGWFGESCNEDINECEFDIPPCSNPRTECVNTLGSYGCKCRVGFSLSNKGICTDIDECKEPHLNNCTQECINTIGSFSCECKNGFTRKDQTSCDDINECELGIFDCEQKCVNNRGQYSCYCHYGYTLNDDRRTCSKIEDPCLSINNLTCSHFCELVDHNAVCGCQNGFIIQNDNQTCTDVNECKNTEKNECEDNSTCFNTEGSYMCNCPIGKRLENDGRTCTDCDQYHYGRNCANNCSCLKGICDKKTGCICDPGWAGDRCETDIDECFTGQVTCQVLHSTCINLPGTAFCLCDVGYQNISGVCEDINECSDDSLNDCDHQCTNTAGSYSCSCQRGFAFDDASCKDTDECASSHDCDQGCTNTIGSYRCFCKEGFRLDLTNRESCIALQECNETPNNTCPKDSVCFVKNDQVHCRCLKGYKEIDNTCTDIDECQEYNPCSHKCLNTLGRYNCSCNDGFILRPDKRTCKACDNWQYGHDCGKSCSCNKSFTESCNGETGECRCRSGMIGSTCDIDVDECSNKSICPNNSYCVNTLGSFTCKCHEGYFKTGINSCDECDFRHFGKHCLNDCQCKFENTKDCNHVTGACTCTQEWEGDTCMDDLDECLNNTNVCMYKEWSTCTNKIGSFTCDCNIGFMEYDNRCQDVNECRNNQNICNKNTVCVNTFGSYVCDCKRGFVMSSMGECIEDKTEGIKKPDSGIWIEAVAVIEMELPEETNLNAASIYLNIQMKLIDMLRIYFKKFTESVLHLTINDIKKGSLITNFTATYDTAENNFTSQLVAGILQLGNGAQLLYDGQLVNVSSDTFYGQLPCMIFNVIGGSCGDGYACILEDGIPVCSFQNEQQDGNSQLVTGLAVIGTLILLGLALFILCILILRKRTQSKKLSSQRRFMTDTVTEGECDGGSEFYRNSKWQDGKVVYTGIRDGTHFMLPRYIPTYLNFPIQSPFASSTARSRNDDLIAS